MFVVTVNFSVKRNQIEQFKPLMLENARLSLELEPGCQQFDVCFDSNEPWAVSYTHLTLPTNREV